MQLFQTETIKRKKAWHILKKEDETGAHPLCNVAGYHYKEGQLKENMNSCEYTGKEQLCAPCVMRAYAKKLIKIKVVV